MAHTSCAGCWLESEFVAALEKTGGERFRAAPYSCADCFAWPDGGDPRRNYRAAGEPVCPMTLPQIDACRLAYERSGYDGGAIIAQAVYEDDNPHWQLQVLPPWAARAIKAITEEVNKQ